MAEITEIGEQFEELRADLMDLKDYSTGSVGTMLEELTSKKFYDEELGNAIKNSIGALIKRLPEPGSQKYFDEHLGESIKEALSEALVNIAKLGRPTINLAPVVEIASEVSKTNKSILDLMTTLSTTDNTSKYDGLLTTAMEMISKSNEFLKKALNQIDYTNNFKGIESALKRPTKWTFTVTTRDHNGRFQTVEAEAKK